jgi:hypothetical protein
MLIFKLIIIVLAVDDVFKDSPFQLHDENLFVFGLVNFLDDDSMVDQLNQVFSQLMIVT